MILKNRFSKNKGFIPLFFIFTIVFFSSNLFAQSDQINTHDKQPKVIIISNIKYDESLHEVDISSNFISNHHFSYEKETCYDSNCIKSTVINALKTHGFDSVYTYARPRARGSKDTRTKEEKEQNRNLNRRVRRMDFLKKAYVEIEINKLAIHYKGKLKNSKGRSIKQNNPKIKIGGFLNYTLGLKWVIKDRYDHIFFEDSLEIKSRPVPFSNHHETKESNKIGLERAFEMALKNILSEEKAGHYMYKQKESFFIPKSKITISNNPSSYSTALTDVVESSGHIIFDDKKQINGFFISNEGHFLTHFHPNLLTKDIAITLNSQKTVKAKLLQYNLFKKFAILKTEEKLSVNPVRILTDKTATIAQEILVIGTPPDNSLGNTISKGIISGLRKNDSGKLNFYQTDASINEGYRGAIMVNEKSEALGIISSKIFGVGIEGLGFAIPIYSITQDLNLTLN